MINFAFLEEDQVTEKAEEGGKGKSTEKGPASIGELHEMIEDIVKTTKNIEKSRKTRSTRGKIGKGS